MGVSKEQAEGYMRKCIDLAHEGAKTGQYPLASLVVLNDEVLSFGSSALNNGYDPTAHPEMTVIRQACEKAKSRYIPGAILVTTLEPCPMCTSAAIWAKFDGIIFGASQEDALEWSELNPHSKFSWRQIKTKAEVIINSGDPKLWLMKNILQNECIDLFDVASKSPVTI